MPPKKAELRTSLSNNKTGRNSVPVGPVQMIVAARSHCDARMRKLVLRARLLGLEHQ